MILTQAGDIHGCAVDYVLKCLGTVPHLIDTSNLLRDQSLSIEFGRNGVHLELAECSADLDMILSSWNRRVATTYNIPPSTIDEDLEFVGKNAALYMRGVLSILDERFPVNHSSALFASANKLRQLKCARECGLATPITLISNNSEEILEFLATHSEVCVKPYVGHAWWTDDGVLVANNTPLTREMIADVRDLEIVPHIYQSFVKKKHEYRVTMFGEYSAATRIRSSELSGPAAADWRASMEYLNHLEPVVLDDKIIGACKTLLRRLGLRFGTFDLAEDEDSNFYFFEVNEAGQWLWQELHCRDCVLLEPFARFLACANDRFVWDSSNSREEFSAVEVLKAIKTNSSYESMLTASLDRDKSLFTDERSGTPRQASARR